MHYEPPAIQTDNKFNTPEQQWDSGTVALQQSLNSKMEVASIPIYEPAVFYSVPPVPYMQHIAAGRYDPQIMTWSFVGTAPTIPRGGVALNYGILQAANPIPTYSQVGVHGQLRAPGINEGV